MSYYYSNINEAYDDYANRTGFHESLIGRASMSILKLFKKGVDFVRLQYFKRRLENELAAGVIRFYDTNQEETEINTREKESDEENNSKSKINCNDILTDQQKNSMVKINSTIEKLDDCDQIVKIKELYTNIVSEYKRLFRVVSDINTKLISASGSNKSTLISNRNNVACRMTEYEKMIHKLEIKLEDCGENTDKKVKELEATKVKLLSSGEMLQLPQHDQKILNGGKHPLVKVGDFEFYKNKIVDTKNNRVGNEDLMIETLKKIKVNEKTISAFKSFYEKIFPHREKFPKIYSYLNKVIKDYESVDTDYEDVTDRKLLKSNESFGYDIIYEKAGSITNKKIGYRKPIGEDQLDWDLLKDKEKVAKMIEFYMDKEKGAERRKNATDLVNKPAIAAIQNAVENIVYHKETPVSNKMYPGRGGGTSNQETSMAKIWRNMVNNILADYKFFLNVDEVNPFNLDRIKNNSTVKMYSKDMIDNMKDNTKYVKFASKVDMDEKSKLSDELKDKDIYLVGGDYYFILKKIGKVNGKYLFKFSKNMYPVSNIMDGDDKENKNVSSFQFTGLCNPSIIKNYDKKKTLKIDMYNPSTRSDMGTTTFDYYACIISNKNNMQLTETDKKLLEFLDKKQKEKK